MYIDLKVYENSRTSLSNTVPIGHLDQLNYINLFKIKGLKFNLSTTSHTLKVQQAHEANGYHTGW